MPSRSMWTSGPSRGCSPIACQKPDREGGQFTPGSTNDLYFIRVIDCHGCPPLRVGLLKQLTARAIPVCKVCTSASRKDREPITRLGPASAESLPPYKSILSPAVIQSARCAQRRIRCRYNFLRRGNVL